MATVETKIEELLDTYLAAFNASSFTQAAQYYSEPAVAITSSGLTLLPSRADLATFLLTTVSRLKQEGFDHSEWVGVKKVEVLENEGEKGLVMVRCGCRRLRGDGTCVEEFGVVYTLRKAEGRWLVVAIHQFPLGKERV